jgi:hypothetical protein
MITKKNSLLKPGSLKSDQIPPSNFKNNKVRN